MLEFVARCMKDTEWELPILPRGAYLSGWSSMASERLPFRHKQYILKRHGFRVSALDCFSHLKAHFFGPNHVTGITSIQDKDRK